MLVLAFALMTPVVMMAALFALDAFENWLFPPLPATGNTRIADDTHDP
ncbi:hypothetical protein [Streptomyces sp. AGS-58]